MVTEFIASGEPVGSRTLAKKYDFALSPATIRNVLADLEDAGYLTQPHTSAGRVPTLLAYRFFVKALIKMRQLTEVEGAKLARLEELQLGDDIVRVGGRVLSDLTGSAAVAVRPTIQTRTLRTLRFIPTRPRELLAVVVFADGTVENRYVALENTLSNSQLERLHNVLEEVVEGRTLPGVREQIEATLDARRGELVALREVGLSLVDDAVRQIDLGADIIVEGQERLLDNPDLKSADHVRTLVRALDDRERLVSLIDRTLASTRVQVFFGEEVSGSDYPMTLVAAPYHETEGQPGGVLGVLGPTRMDYPMILPLVSAAAEAVSTALSRHRDNAVRPTGRSPNDGPEGDESD